MAGDLFDEWKGKLPGTILANVKKETKNRNLSKKDR